MKHTTMLGAFMVCILLTSAALAQTGWSGESNESGGIVSYGYLLGPEDQDFDPEMAENETFSVRCDGFDGRLSIAFAGNVDPADGHKHNVIFEIDRDRFERSGPIEEGGLYPGAPIALLKRGDPLIEAMMAGYSLRLHVGTERPLPVMEIMLTGTREVFTRHLQACL
ncbi:hypothetical protein [Devosia submarina]|uniref:hypothetical protein n=1 Tax=Devosia submarina TaxID=1173082 RepID=UPI00130057BE|nr:hypothetical protein [Devosia submarina]